MTTNADFGVVHPQARIGHVHLKVADLERAIDFYRRALGFELTQRYGKQAAFLSAGGYHHHIGLNIWESVDGSPPPAGTTGLYHLAIVYPTQSALADALRRVMDAGVSLEGASDHGVSEAIYLRDPDGNGVELYWDRPREAWPRSRDGTLEMFTRPLDLSNLVGNAQANPQSQPVPVETNEVESTRSALPALKSSGQPVVDRAAPKTGTIEMHLRDVSQLFDVLDPSPFREKDIDSDAEEYIVDSTKELPFSATYALLIHLDSPLSLADERMVRDAIRVHFARRSRLLRRDLQQLLRRGLISLGIGVAFLTVFFIIARVLRQVMGDSGVGTLFREGLIIVGWVAMWRPLEIFLYDWWPIVGQRRLYDRLSEITVRIVQKKLSNNPGANDQAKTATAKALARWENEGGRIAP